MDGREGTFCDGLHLDSSVAHIFRDQWKNTHMLHAIDESGLRYDGKTYAVP
jgi:hypothetical protein